MIKIIIIFLITSVFSNMVYSQGVNRIASEDTSITKIQSYNSRLLFLSPISSFPLSFKEERESYPNSLHLEFGSSINSMESIIEQNLDVSGIWKIGALKDEELKTFRSILGSVKLGGVAYLAYKRIKKFGLK